MQISINDILEIVSEALSVESALITQMTTMDDFEEWDSLAQLAILTNLDYRLGGEASGLRDLAEAESVREILVILGKHSLLQG